MSIWFNWLETKETIITDCDEWNELVRKVKKNTKGNFPFYNKVKWLDMYHAHSCFDNECGAVIREWCLGEDPHAYRFSFTGASADSVGAGSEGYHYINEAFEASQTKKTKVSIWKAFGGQKYAALNKAIKECVITQVDYANPKYLNTVIEGCFKSDVSSAYPSQLSKSLPTLHDHKIVDGYAQPTEEYPFAFYLNSHHVAIYDELDTRDLNSSLYKQFYVAYDNEKYKWTPLDYISNENEKTVLCKACKYSLKDIFEDMYAHRKENPKFKLWMNACIGYFHKNTAPFLSHIAAVVLARCAFDMVKRARQLKLEGNTVLLINTDSIIWKGKQSSLSTPADQKKMGSFAVEYENIRVFIKGVKAYQLDTPTGVITKYSGARREDSAKMKFGEIGDANITGVDDGFVFNKITYEIHRK